MRKKPRKKTHVKSVQKNSLSFFSILADILVSVGKPFYLIISGGVALISFLQSKFTKLVKKSKQNKTKRDKKKTTQQNKPLTDLLKLAKLRIILLLVRISTSLRTCINNFTSRVKKISLNSKVIVIASLLLIITSYLYYFILKDLPSPQELTKRDPEVSTKIYDRNGILLYKIYKDKNRTIINLSDIPEHVRLATLAAEDAEFYNHPGFSIKGILRAISQDIQKRSLQGGSTITQQLVKNVLLSPERTFTRKIKELILAIEVETNYTKDQILEMYLNEVSYGGTAYGIQSASESYFGKGVKDLTLGEAAFLAGLPKSPTLYSPFGQNPESAFDRQKEVLRLMRVNKFISVETEKQALSEKITFVQNRTEIKAPHFVMYIRQILVDKYGEDIVEKGGLEVITSLDMNIQDISEQIVKSEIEKIKNLNVGNGAAMVLNPQTGEVLSMVGSKNYFDTPGEGQVNVLLRLRQPGSSIKLINYVYALSNGYNAASIIDDSPITYVIPGSAPYSPVNYDGKYKGRVSLRTAFAESRNIPAVKILASYGVDKMIDLAEAMGITTWADRKNYGLSLTLGGGAVKAIDLAQAYATIANAGKKPEILPILEIRNYKGKVLEKNTPRSDQVVDPRVAFITTDILKDNYARSGEFGFNSYLVVKNHPEVAVKTGTSNDLRDNWTVGYNQNFLVLTWVGNNNNKPMSRIASGVTGASPIWNKIITTLLAETESVDWKAPAGVSKINICQSTAMLPCDGCTTKQEWFLDEKKPSRSCKKETSIPVDQNKILDGAKTEFKRP